MKDFLLFLKNLIYNWLYCIFNPLSSCRYIVIEKRITEIEKIQYAFGIWLTAFMLTVSLEIPIFSFFKVEWVNPKFYIPYLCIGFIYMILVCACLHFWLKIFRIPSKLNDTFLIYSILFGSFSPFILLGMYPLIIKNYFILKVFKEHDYDLMWLFNNLKSVNNDIDNIFVIYISMPISNIITHIISCSLTVLFCLFIIEKYNCAMVKTFICVTFSQILFLLPPLLLLKIFEYFVVLQNLKLN